MSGSQTVTTVQMTFSFVSLLVEHNKPSCFNPPENIVDQAPSGSVTMELSQKVQPFGNVKGPLLIKYLHCWQNTGGGLTQNPQLKFPIFLFSLCTASSAMTSHGRGKGRNLRRRRRNLMSYLPLVYRRRRDENRRHLDGSIRICLLSLKL